MSARTWSAIRNTGHTRESAQNKPHSSSPPGHLHLWSHRRIVSLPTTLRSKSTRALIKSDLSQHRATPYVYHSKSAPNSETSASQDHTTQTSVLERRTLHSKTSALRTSYTSIKCSQSAEPANIRSFKRSNMQASRYHVYERESLKPNQYCNWHQVRNKIQAISSQEPSSVDSRTQSNSLQSGQNKFQSSQAKHSGCTNSHGQYNRHKASYQNQETPFCTIGNPEQYSSLVHQIKRPIKLRSRQTRNKDSKSPSKAHVTIAQALHLLSIGK